MRGVPREAGSTRCGVSTCFCTLFLVLAGCADSTDSGAVALLKEGLAARDASTETRSSEESPRLPVGLAQSSSSTVSRDEVADARGLWVVSRTANAEGTFVLLRNLSGASEEAAVVHATRGDGPAEALGPRETAVWECNGAVRLTLRNDNGTVIFDAVPTCGDAVYVRRGAAVSSAPR